MVISTLQIASHLLPFTEPERINFATTTLIAFSVFHISIVEQVPKSSDSVPLLAIYVDSLMCLIGLSLIECFIIMNWISRVGYTVPPPRIWYILVECAGPYLLLGSTGYNWRKNYLRVLLKVQDNMEKMKKKESELKRIVNVTTRKKLRRESKVQTAFQGFEAKDLQALVKLVEIWGDVCCDAIYRERVRKMTRPMASNFQSRPSMMKFNEYQQQTPDLSKKRESRVSLNNVLISMGSALSHYPLNHGLQIGKSSTVDFEGQFVKDNSSISLGGVPRASSTADLPDSRGFKRRKGNNKKCEISEPSQSMSRATSQQRLQYEEEEEEKVKEMEEIIQRMNGSLNEQITALQKITRIVDDIAAHIVSQQLKRECIGVWTTYITAVDRVNYGDFLLLFFIDVNINPCLFTFFFLFIYGPTSWSQ